LAARCPVAGVVMDWGVFPIFDDVLHTYQIQLLGHMESSSLHAFKTWQFIMTDCLSNNKGGTCMGSGVWVIGVINVILRYVTVCSFSTMRFADQ